MYLGFTAEDEAFRQRLRTWLQENLPSGWGTPAYKQPETEDAIWEFRRQWEDRLYHAGWVGVSWPTEYGGMGLSLTQEVIFYEEYARAAAPDGVNDLGRGILGPTLILRGTDAQKKRFLPRILSNEEIWCQGYSEPNAGSDLASLQTRAVREGDVYVVNGQKIWTSYAHQSDWCFLLVRTDPTAPKHKGISFLLVDLKTPGITIRPIQDITTRRTFNEVFFDNVRVPVENIVGKENEGWPVSMAAASFERGVNLIHGQVSLRKQLRQLVTYATRVRRGGRPALEHPGIQERFARVFMDVHIMRLNTYRNLTTVLRGEAPGPETSYNKLFFSEVQQRVFELAADLMGPLAQLGPNERTDSERARLLQAHLMSRCYTIVAGTSEIQRNVISERGLGLPR